MPAVELGLRFYKRQHNSFPGLGAFHYEEEGRYPVRYYKFCHFFFLLMGRKEEKNKSIQSYMETAEDFRQEEQAGNSGSSKHFDTMWQRQKCKHWQIVK